MNRIELRNMIREELEQGKFLGRTKTGRSIYSTKSAFDYDDFLKADHLDAIQLHMVERNRLKTLAGNELQHKHNQRAEQYNDFAIAQDKIIQTHNTELQRAKQ